MRIFVSSSFEDLREHRAAAIRVLRQLGHEVLAMEDMIAGSATPLAKVLEMVDRSEAYVGVFAWRYGYVPSQAADPRCLRRSISRLRQMQSPAKPRLRTMSICAP